MATSTSIQVGQCVRIAPGFRDPGDEHIEWIVLESNGDRLVIEAQVAMNLKPTQTVRASMVEAV